MADDGGLRYRILRSSQELFSIREDWDRLWTAAEAEYSLGFPSMHRSWEMIHRPQGRSLECAVACDRDRLFAVLPMISFRHKAWKTASTCGPRAAECPDMLMEKSPHSNAIATALLERFVKATGPDYLEFEFVRLGSHLETAIRQVACLRVLSSWDHEVPYANLSAEKDWQSYYGSLNRKYQADCARCLRRLSEHGKVTFEVVTGRSTSLIDWLFQQKRNWCERTNKRGDWVFSERYRAYVNALFASDRRYLVFALRLDGAPIAVKLVAVNTSSGSGVLAAYDAAYARFSPGRLLDERVMQYLFENHRARDGRFLDISFGPGSERFKQHWCRDSSHLARSYRIVASGWGQARVWTKNLVGIASRASSNLRKGTAAGHAAGS